MQYILQDRQGGQVAVMARGSNVMGAYRWTPGAVHDGARQVVAALSRPDGGTVATAPIPVTIHTGAVHSPRPAMPRAQFADFVRRLALESY